MDKPYSVGGLIERLQRWPFSIVEVCESHPENPSPNIFPIERAKLLAALTTAERASDNEVERVARAIYESDMGRFGMESSWAEDEWADEEPRCRRQAAAVLAALRKNSS